MIKKIIKGRIYDENKSVNINKCITSLFQPWAVSLPYCEKKKKEGDGDGDGRVPTIIIMKLRTQTHRSTDTTRRQHSYLWHSTILSKDVMAFHITSVLLFIFKGYCFCIVFSGYFYNFFFQVHLFLLLWFNSLAIYSSIFLWPSHHRASGVKCCLHAS